MNVDKEPRLQPSPSINGEDDEGWAWLSAVRRGDREAFEKILRHTQEWVVAHLLGAVGLSRDEALDVTRQTMLDALDAVGQRRTIESPLARLFGTARAVLGEHLRAAATDADSDSDVDLEVDLDPDPAALRAFYDADPEVDRQLADRRNLLPFLELMHDAVQSLPVEQQEAIRTQPLIAENDGHKVLREVAAALLVTNTRPSGCAVLDEHLRRATWEPGHPFSSRLRQWVLHHVGGCPVCLSSYHQATQRIGSLPALVLSVVLALDEQRRDIMHIVFAAGRLAVDDQEPAAEGDQDVAATVATAVIEAVPVPPEAPPERRPKRTIAVAATAVLLLAFVLGAWRWNSATNGAPGRLGVGSPSRGPAARVIVPAPATPGGGGSAPSSPSGGTHTVSAGSLHPAPSRSPSLDPSTATSPTPSPAPPSATVPGTATSPSPGAGPTHRLVIRLSLQSTGTINVLIGGTQVGTCTDPGGQCEFSIRSGDAVTLDPVDAVSSWGSGPCGGTDPSASCVFTATGNAKFDLQVLRG